MARALRYLLTIVLSVVAYGALAPCATAQDDPHAGDRKQLLAIVAEAEAAINAQDVDRFAALFTEEATVTWLNAEVSKGRDAIRAYHRKMVGASPEAILTKYLTKVTVPAPARFFGDVAVAYGTAADEFYPKSRDVFRFDSHWSAALVKAGGGWKITSLHLSTNVFTNNLTAEYESTIKRVGWWAGLAGLVAGGLLAGLVFRRRAS